MRLQTRLALLFGVVVIAAASVIGSLGYVVTAKQLARHVDESLLAVSGPVSDQLASVGSDVDLTPERPSRRGDRDDVMTITTNLVLPTQVVLPSGSVLTSSTAEVRLPVDAADVALAAGEQAEVRFRDVTVDGAEYRMVTQTAGNAKGAVQVGRDVSENAAVLGSLALWMALIGVLVAVLAALAGWWLARRSARRLVQLTEAAETVAATGRVDVDVPSAGSDEIARLGGAFDAMLVRLGQAREDQQRLVQDAGHELRTPLTSLRTNVQLLRRFGELPEATRARIVADLDGETRELTHLLDEVVQLAGWAPADAAFEPVLLVGPAQSAVDRAIRRTGRQVTLQADDSTVLGQVGLLERVIWNLVENAAKFSPADTPIDVVVDRGCVIVSDRGPGIDPADLPHVFDRFYRATAARSLPGSGLGLAIVRDVVEAHGGQVMAANRPGGGAQLGFRLPLVPPGA